ncbi:hypothetical protein ABGB19_21635 [Mycobacterium sp. B14F4]|uniref:hypothetical protein n=1 Tax=Mycobacterium sp. B14F4 TaxID=3153565 RepID=UPI00325E1F4C
MKYGRWAAVALACVLTGCDRVDEGVPVAAETTAPTTSSPAAPGAATPATPGAGGDEPGVVPTTTAAVPPDTTTCEVSPPPPVGVVASVDDPAAPKITVALPTGWSTTAGEGDVGARLTGPDGVWATVTIAETPLGPAEAFREYADNAMAASTVSSISVLPAELCDYSGQKLLGSWSDSPQQAVEFGDRIAHIWTDTATYLVAVHVEGPARTEFDPFASPLMDDFAVVIP